MSSPRTFEVGDRVTWHHVNGTTTGRVIDIIEEPATLRELRYNEPTPAEARYVVESDRSGARAALKAEELTRIE